jgi:hypothetical protein
MPSTEKAKRTLGYGVTTNLEKILPDVVPWIEKAVADGTI